MRKIKRIFKALTCRHIFKKTKKELRYSFLGSVLSATETYQGYQCIDCKKEIEMEITDDGY